MATDNENNLQRRLEDQHPDATIAWDQPGAPAVPLSSTAGAARQGGVTSEESGGVASIPPSTAPAPTIEPMHKDVEWLVEAAEMARKNPEMATQIRAKCKVNSFAPAPQTDPTQIAWAHDLQERLMVADDQGDDELHNLLGEAACCLCALTGRPGTAARAKAAPAPQQSELSAARIEEFYGKAVNAHDTTRHIILDFARAIERETMANMLKAADAKIDIVADQAAQAAPSAPTDEVLSLHRQLAAEKLRADQGWERADAKSKECIELRERMAASKAAPSAKAEPSLYVSKSTLDHIAASSFVKHEITVRTEPNEGWVALAAPAPAVQAEDVRNQALTSARIEIAMLAKPDQDPSYRAGLQAACDAVGSLRTPSTSQTTGQAEADNRTSSDKQ